MKRFGSHNKIMVLGTAAADETGELYLSDIARRRCDRAAEAYFGYRFKRDDGSMLLSGGYGKALEDAPPIGREARLMADYLIKQYGIPPRALLLEDESTTTEENFAFSLEQYPEFFEEIVNGERKLGLVSDEDHLVRAAMIGSWVLKCSERQFTMLPTWKLVDKGTRVAIIPEVTALPLERVGTEQYEAMAADE